MDFILVICNDKADRYNFKVFDEQFGQRHYDMNGRNHNTQYGACRLQLRDLIFIEASPVCLILNVKNTYVWHNLITFMVGFIDLFIPHLGKWELKQDFVVDF